MIENAHNDDLLIRYLDNELAGPEKAALEARLQTDEALREQLTNLKVAIQAIRQLGITQKVQAVHADMMKELKESKKSKVVSFGKTLRYTLAIAASLLVLLLGVKFYQAAQLSPEGLYKESFVDFNVSASRGSMDHRSQIESLYQQKKYDSVTAGVRPINLDAKDSLLIGLSYLQTNRAAQAIGFFQPVAASVNDYQQDAEFYLALSHLKNKTYKKALALMEKIAASPSHLYYHQLSTDVMEKVKKLAAK